MYRGRITYVENVRTLYCRNPVKGSPWAHLSGTYDVYAFVILMCVAIYVFQFYFSKYVSQAYVNRGAEDYRCYGFMWKGECVLWT